MTHSPLENPLWNLPLDIYPTTLTWSKDTSLLAVGSAEGTLTLLERDTGNTKASYELHKEAILSVVWHPKRALLATCGEDGAVMLLNTDNGQVKQLQEPGDAWAEQIAWSPDGSALATSTGKQATLFETSGKVRAKLPALESTITGLAWSPNNKLLGCACYGGVRLFFGRTGKFSRRLDWQGSMINLHWSPDGKVIVCGCQDNSIHFWRLSNGKDSMMSGYPAKPASLSWSRDSKMLASTGGREVAVWDFVPPGPEGKPPLFLEGHPKNLTCVAFSPSSTVLASGCRAGMIHLWLPTHQPEPVSHFLMEGRIENLVWGKGKGPRDLWLAASDSQGHVMVVPLGGREE